MKYILISSLSLITGSAVTISLLLIGLLTRNKFIIQCLKASNTTYDNAEKRQIKKNIN